MPVLPLRNRVRTRGNRAQVAVKTEPSFARNLSTRAASLLSILGWSLLGVAGQFVFNETASAQEEPITPENYEREELGVNEYTTPSIARIFQQLDQLRPLPFEQLRRQLPETTAISREQNGLIFGGLIADGFLLVEAQRKNLVEDFGRILLRQARGLSVADRVLRHSASLTELARRGDWTAVRQELIATQADVEGAMMELRDQKMAHLISLGGWLRGLEISAGAVARNFSPVRAKVLAQPDLLEYFTAELRTLAPATVQTPLFQQIRTGVKAVRATLSKPGELTLADVQTVHGQARELNTAIRTIGNH
jgi:hypothetical protein